MGPVLKVRLASLVQALVLAGVALPISAAGQQPAAADTSASVGPANAPYVLTVYSDFACQPCGHLAVVLQELVASRPETVRVIFKHAPSEDGHGRDAHLAAAAAALQGRFWDMHNVLFANQDRLSAADTLGMAEQIGLDLGLFRAALTDPEVVTVVDADAADARRLGVTARPYILINGAPFTALPTLENLSRATGRP